MIMRKNKIKIIAILLSAICLNFVISVNAADNNLLINGSFVEGDATKKPKITLHWGTSSWWQWTWDDNVGYDDNTSMHFNEGSATYQYFYQKVNVEQNTDYVLTFYYKSDDPGITVQAFGDGNAALIGEQWIRDVADDWVKKTYTINSGSSNTIQVNFKLMGQAGGASETANGYIDNISLVARKPVVESVSLSGYSAIGNTVTVRDIVTDSFGDTVIDSEYQWQISDDGIDWTDIDGATENVYEISEGDIGFYLRVQVTPVSKGKDGATRKGKASFSKTLRVSEMSAYFSIDITGYFNEKLIASEDELMGNVVLDKVGLEKAIGESNAVIYNEIPYVLELNAENNAIATNADKDLVIDLGNEYLSSVNFAFAYWDAPQSEQSAIIKYNDGTTEEITYIPGLVFEKSEGAINADAFGMYEEGGEKAEDKGYIYSCKLKMDKVAGIESVTFPCANTEGKLMIYALSGERVDKEVIREKLEAEILTIPQHIKPTDFSLLDNIEESAQTYELLGGNVSDISGFDLERFAELRVEAVLNAYNDGDSKMIFNSEDEFLYEDWLGLDTIDQDGVTIYSLYEELISEEGKKTVQKELVKKNFEDVSELHEELLKNIILKAIQFPNVGGVEYVSDILTEENTEKVGLSAEKYFSAEDKSAIHKVVARGSYNNFDELEKDLVPAPKKTPSKGSGGGGGGGSVGIIPTVTQKPVEENKEENKPEDKENVNSENIQNVQDIQNNPTDLVMFKDVTDTHWAYKPIYRLKDLEIVSGKSKEYFAPDGFVTREEFVKMLCLAFNIEKDSSKTVDFLDVETGAWYEKYIDTAYSKGIVTGINENKFGIGIELTRQDLCVMAVRVRNLEESTVEELDFTDSESVSEYAKSAVSYLVKNGVVNGFEDGSFKPQEKCTRAQAAKIIYELMEVWRDE